MKKVLAPLVLAALVFTGCNTQSSTSKGKDGQELKLSTPKSVKVAQDGTAEFKVSITRTKFDEPVDITFDKLPTGVTVEPGATSKIDKGVTDRTYTLKATDKAEKAKATFKVSAKHGSMEDSHNVDIEITEKGTKSTSGSSPLPKEEELKKNREALNTTVKTKMTEIDASMATLRERAKTADASAKVEMNKRIEELDKQRQSLNTELQKAQETTAEQWAAFSTRVNNATNDLARGASEAVERFKKK